MNVLIDRHHAGLFHSLQLLGDRLGWTVYTPIGQLWWEAEYWNFGRSHWGDDRLAQQFLNPAQFPAIPVRHPYLNTAEVLNRIAHPFADPEFPTRDINLVTLPQAIEMTWDLVIATVEDNQLGFWRFAKEHNARYAVHVGNTNQRVDTAFNPLILNASEVPGGVHIGEEFASDNLFGYREPFMLPSNERPAAHPGPPWTPHVSSFVNCFTSMATWPLFEEARSLQPDWHWKVYGIDGADGVVKPIDTLAGAMSASDFGWHDKEHGDGYGHVLHYWAAIGRPLVGHASHYAGKNGHRYWRDLETCIDLDRHSIPETLQLIRELSDDGLRYRAMCQAIRAEFDAETDWAGDARKVAELLEAVPA